MSQTQIYRYLTATVLTGFAAFPAYGQQVQTSSSSASLNADSDAYANEIIVTAQRRAESVQDVPIAMNVYSGDDLAKVGATDIQSLSAIAPGINFAQTGGLAYISIRGISSRDLTEVGDPAVLISQDGFFVNRPYSLFASLYDIQRVEVLKGPQGTLYGRSAIGGAINIITADPKHELGGFGIVEVGNYDTINTQGALNVPLADNLAFRTAFSSRSHKGYRDNGTGFDRGDDEDSKSVRATLLYTQGDHFRATLAAQYVRQDGVGVTEQTEPFAFDANGFVIHQRPALGDPEKFDVLLQSKVRMIDKRIRWEMSYDGLPGELALTYRGGFDSLRWDHVVDSTPPGQPARPYVQSESPDTWNHEVRLASPDKQRFIWQVGGFYFREDSSVASISQLADGTRLATFIYPNVKTRSYALFGQASFDIIDQLTVTGGLRYNWDKKTRDGAFTILQAATGLPFDIVFDQAGRFSAEKLTWHAGLDWKPARGQLVYAKVDKGYKAGGFTTFSSYAPETVTAYELGSKTDLAAGLTLNASVFYQDYRDKQVSQFVADGSGTFIQNARKTEIYGAEAQLQGQLGPDTDFMLEVDYLHARFKDFLASPNVALDPNSFPNCSGSAGQQLCQLDGYSVPLSPDWTVAATLGHVFRDIWNGEIEVRAQTRYTSAQNFDFFNLQTTRQKSYTVSNANVTYTHGDGDWSLGLYVRNLENRTYFTQASENPNFQQYVYSYGAPRTFGARFQVNF